MKTSFATILMSAAALATSASAKGACLKVENIRTLISGTEATDVDPQILCESLFNAYTGQCGSVDSEAGLPECYVGAPLGPYDGKLVFHVPAETDECTNRKLEHVWWEATGNEYGEVQCT